MQGTAHQQQASHRTYRARACARLRAAEIQIKPEHSRQASCLLGATCLASGIKTPVCWAEFSGCHSQVSCHRDGAPGWTCHASHMLREEPSPRDHGLTGSWDANWGSKRKQAGTRLGGQELPCISTTFHVWLRDFE